jgi:predicted amidohydrolase
VVDELRGRPVKHVTEIGAALLRVCRANAAFIDLHKTEPGFHRPLLALESRLRMRFAQWVRPRWPALELGALADMLEQAATVVPAPLVAWQTARWLEKRWARHLVGYFVDCDRSMLPGDAWPITESPARCYTTPTGNPASRGRSADRGDWLTLVPEQLAGVDVRLRWCGPWLPPLRRGLRIAVAVLARSTDDFDIDRLDPSDAPRFYRVRPRSPTYWERIDRALEHAVRERAEILILPELSLTEELHARFVADPRVATIPLVVAGSRHTEVVADEPGRNLTSVLSSGRVIAEHAKMSDFFFRDGDVERFEHVRPGTTMQVLLSEQSTLLVLICKDALRDDWQHLVQKLAPRLLLIPAMSRESADFAAFAERLARNPQAVTVVANIGAKRVIVGRPSREEVVFIGDSPVGTCFVYEVGSSQSGGSVG